MRGHPLSARSGDAPSVALRDASNRTGAKQWLLQRRLGSCTVIVDGRAALSCQLTIAAAEGAEVTTIEGLSAAGPPAATGLGGGAVSHAGAVIRASSWPLSTLMRSTPNPTTESTLHLPNISAAGGHAAHLEGDRPGGGSGGAVGCSPDRADDVDQRIVTVQQRLILRSAVRTKRPMSRIACRSP